jgi:hypothetical protein
VIAQLPPDTKPSPANALVTALHYEHSCSSVTPGHRVAALSGYARTFERTEVLRSKYSAYCGKLLGRQDRMTSRRVVEK